MSTPAPVRTRRLARPSFKTLPKLEPRRLAFELDLGGRVFIRGDIAYYRLFRPAPVKVLKAGSKGRQLVRRRPILMVRHFLRSTERHKLISKNFERENCQN